MFVGFMRKMELVITARNALFVGVVGPGDDIEYIFDIIRMGESDEDVKTVITFCDASGMP